MIDQIEARLALLRMTGIDVDTVLRYTSLAARAVADGLLGYALIIAEKP